MSGIFDKCKVAHWGFYYRTLMLAVWRACGWPYTYSVYQVKHSVKNVLLEYERVVLYHAKQHSSTASSDFSCW